MNKPVIPFKSCLFLSLASFILETQALPSVYKVESLYKNGDIQVRKGSGVGLTISGSDYILTSSHVIFHGTDADSISHFSLSESGTRAKHSLVAVDFSRGLALLKSPVPLEGGFSFEEWKAEPADVAVGSSGNNLIGFPYGVNPPVEKPLITHDAFVESSQTMRVILPFIKSVIEVKSRSDFGMSGGAFVSSTGRYLGMISHHYLKQVSLGDAASLFEYTDSDLNQTVITPLIIPVREIIPWVENAVAGGKESNLREDLKSQLAGGFSVQFSGLQFSEVNCRKNSIPTEPRKVAKTVKGKVYLASSGDGAGIGGDLKKEDGNGKCVVSVTKSQQGSQDAWPFAAARSVEFIRTKLNAHVREVEWESLLDPNSFEVYGIANLMHALTWVQRGHLPLFKDAKFFGNSSAVLDEHLSRLAQILKVHAAKLHLVGSQTPTLKKMLSEVDGIYDLLANDMSSVLAERAKRLEEIALPETGSEYENAWLELSRLNSDSAARLQSALIGIHDRFKERGR